MQDIGISIVSLLFFLSVQRQFDSCFITAFAANILHILVYSMVLVPYVLQLIRLAIKKQLSKETFSTLYIKVITMLNPMMEIFSILIILLNLVCLFSIVANVFSWKNYDYLFLIYCITSSTLSDVSFFLKIEHDSVMYYSNQVMKLFNLSIAFIFFAISTFTQDVYIDIYAIGFGYLLCRFKDSIPRNIIYCFFLFANTIYLLTSISIGGLFYLYSHIQFEGTFEEGNKSALIIFYIFLLSLQIFQVIKIIGQRSEIGRLQRKIIQDHWNHCVQTGKLYAKIRKLTVLAKGNEQDYICSICQLGKQFPDFRVTLKCSHTYHLDCIVGWLSSSGVKKTCPLCRMIIYEQPWIQEYFR